ncbi:uncharacterized protein [Drosophila suzukii]|uniref:Transposase n=1 Tax=Drosophila suzukii TaxID=28584 RepID=A0ABM4TNS2_DROSZ
MQFTNINLFKNGNNAVKAAFGYAENHEGDLKKGSLMMTSQFTQILKNPRPFVIIFDEFHLKKIPSWRFESWKVMVVAIATFDGKFFKIVHIQMMSTEIGKIGSVDIKNGVREAFYFAKRNGLQHHLVGAVSDGNAANQDAIQWLLQKGVPTVYDHRHLCGRLVQLGVADGMLRHAYRHLRLRKGTYMRVLGEMATKANIALASNHTALAHYKQEFGRMEFLLRNIYQVVPEEEEVSLTSINSDLLEDIGQKWAFLLDEAFKEVLSVSPEVREDEEQALLLVGSLVAVMAITEDPYSP